MRIKWMALFSFKEKPTGWMALLIMLLSCTNNMTHNKKELEKILHTELNVSEDKIQYYKWRPNDETTLTETYAKFPMNDEEYSSLLERAHFHKKADKGEALGYFPFHWKTYSQVTLEWWDASPENPEDGAVKKIEGDGIVMIKHENGFVYMVVKTN